MRRTGYGTYRGRSGFRTFLKVLIALLLIVLLLGVAAFFLLEDYMVFDGQAWRLRLPFGQETAAPPSPAVTSEPEIPLVIVTPTPEPEEEKTLHAVLLPRTALYDGTAERQVTDGGGNAAVFDMKADDGSLGYLSALELAKTAKTSAADPALNAAIQSLNRGELYTIARVSCFLDNQVPQYKNAMAIRSGGGNWRDGGGVRWLSPTADEARRYIADICRELAALGFDEILLDHSGYPVSGRLNAIKTGAGYDRDRLESVVTGFYDEVRQALADWPDVKLSVVCTEAALLEGTDPDSGQSAAALMEYADRLWIPPPEAEEADYAGALAGLGDEENPPQLVYLLEGPGEEDENWAVLPGA